MEHWFAKPKYSVGKGGKLAHVDSDNEFNNAKASGFADDALVTVLEGDALKKFLFTKDEYTGKGSKKLAKLKADFVGASQLQITKIMFSFFQEFFQGDPYPNSYEAALHELFNKFSLSLTNISARPSKSCP